MFLEGLRTALLGVATLAFASSSAFAQKKYDTGASDTEIRIGNIVPYSGPASAYGVIGKTEGAYFDKINAEGGIKGRKIKFISYDDAYSPPKAVEQARKLVESDQVLLVFSPLGTASNSAIQKYMNTKKVPQLFVASGASKWNDPKDFPWTMGWQPSYQSEAHIYAKYILKEKPGGKIGVLYQNDDFGKDYLKGLKDGLGPQASMIVAEESYETSEPSIDDHVVRLKAAGADVFVSITTPKFAAQAIKKANELSWKPAQFLASPVNSIQGVLAPAGLENVQGAYTTQFTKQAGDPAWDEDPEVKEYISFMKKWVPNDSPNDFIALSGYVNAQAIAKGLQRCGDNLTRENLLAQATSFNKERVGMLLPGIELTNSKENYAPYRSLRMAIFEKTSWKLLGE